MLGVRRKKSLSIATFGTQQLSFARRPANPAEPTTNFGGRFVFHVGTTWLTGINSARVTEGIL